MPILRKGIVCNVSIYNNTTLIYKVINMELKAVYKVTYKQSNKVV